MSGGPDTKVGAGIHPALSLELRVVEISPRHLEMRVTAATDGITGRRTFTVAYSRAKSFLGVVSGSDLETVLTYSADDNLQGVLALVDGGYNNEEQTSPDRTLELMTAEKYGMTVGEWHLPREKHERPLRIDIITGALRALLSENK